MTNAQDKDARVGQHRSDSDSSSAVPAVKPEEGPSIVILNEVSNRKDTAYAFSVKRKWWILTVVALCQTSMSKVPHVPSQAQVSTCKLWVADV